ncbi:MULTISPECIES: hypothetical protein [Pseudoalteromonas]|uniref:Bacteriocin n=1 Tax=Pseudoalteromonas piscicida TaxID=43662 RepID=A0AAD0RLD7_PSEO7|nr:MULTISPECIES: hypothetical protein [Pseudoalteromonas]ASD68808.1 hypothetical protein B1L02_18430 [Pseudoalteromonas piscicida]AXR03865.1 hypothetical protein D0511_18510 [Pseudoalteromonas piscicida]
MQQLNLSDVKVVTGASACTTAFEMSFSVLGTAHGAILGPAGAAAGWGVGYSVGSILGGYFCS